MYSACPQFAATAQYRAQYSDGAVSVTPAPASAKAEALLFTSKTRTVAGNSMERSRLSHVLVWP
jgi:hypothetical protein